MQWFIVGLCCFWTVSGLLQVKLKHFQMKTEIRNHAYLQMRRIFNNNQNFFIIIIIIFFRNLLWVHIRSASVRRF